MNTNMNNPMQFMQLIQSSSNPQQFLMDMLGQQTSNPFFANLYQMAKNNDAKGLEQIARNLVKERGLDFDSEFNSFRQMFRL